LLRLKKGKRYSQGSKHTESTESGIVAEINRAGTLPGNQD